jgi:hypothetical protein
MTREERSMVGSGRRWDTELYTTNTGKLETIHKKSYVQGLIYEYPQSKVAKLTREEDGT